MIRRLFRAARAALQAATSGLEWLEYVTLDRPLDRHAAVAYADAVEAETGTRPAVRHETMLGDHYVYIDMPMPWDGSRMALLYRIHDRVAQTSPASFGRVCFEWSKA